MLNSNGPPGSRAIFLGGPGLHWEERPAPPALAPWVAAFWRLRCDRPYSLRVVPDGCMDIIGDDVVGSLSSALIATLEAGDESMGVRLRPGAFTALFGVPAHELADRRLALADVVRPQSLLKLAAEARPPDPLIAAALRAPDMRALSRETGYSPRHLHRRIVAATGHGPKRLGRIARMQAVLAAGRGESWARTAVELGFHDESHMINDIQSLASATPQQMLEERAARPPFRPS